MTWRDVMKYKSRKEAWKTKILWVMKKAGSLRRPSERARTHESLAQGQTSPQLKDKRVLSSRTHESSVQGQTSPQFKDTQRTQGLFYANANP